MLVPLLFVTPYTGKEGRGDVKDWTGRLLLTLSLVVAMNPEKNDGVRSPTWQGEVKGPWVTVWFLGKKENTRVSLAAAVVMFGVKVRPFLPTSIGMIFATVAETKTLAARASLLNNMMMMVVLLLVERMCSVHECVFGQKCYVGLGKRK